MAIKYLSVKVVDMNETFLKDCCIYCMDFHVCSVALLCTLTGRPGVTPLMI